MARNNSVGQLRASSDFSNAVGVAVLKTFQESQEIQSYMADPEFLQEIIEITADALHAQCSQGKAPAERTTDEERV